MIKYTVLLTFSGTPYIFVYPVEAVSAKGATAAAMERANRWDASDTVVFRGHHQDMAECKFERIKMGEA